MSEHLLLQRQFSTKKFISMNKGNTQIKTLFSVYHRLFMRITFPTFYDFLKLWKRLINLVCSTTCLAINFIQIEWIYHSKGFANHHLVLIAFTRCALRHLRFTSSSISKQHSWHVMLPTETFTASFIIIVASLAGLTYFKEQLAMKPANFISCNISFILERQYSKSREEEKSSFFILQNLPLFLKYMYM